MNRITRTLARVGALVAPLALSLLLALPVLAAEGGEQEKIQLPSSPRDRVGLILIAVMLLVGALALWNARKQLRGERRQASGEFRWR